MSVSRSFVRSLFVCAAQTLSFAGVLVLAGSVAAERAAACDGAQHAESVMKQAQSSKDAPTCAPSAPLPAANGMRATIDPATGRLSETPAPGAAAITSSVSPAPLPEVRELPNGASILNTRGLLHTMTATVAPGGGLPKTDCTQGNSQAQIID